MLLDGSRRLERSEPPREDEGLVAGGGSGQRFVFRLGRDRLDAGCVLLGEEDAVEEATQDAAEDWREPEEPELREGPSTDEEGGTGAAGGVDGEVGNGDTDEVDQG